MKIAGVDPTTLPTEVTLVLPRGDDSTIVFVARGLPSMDEFDKFVPAPKPPGKLTKDGWVANEDDPNYKSIVAEYGRRRLAYIVVKSLEPSNIEWDTVQDDSPGTWPNWEVDLKANGFSQMECNRVIGLCLEANSLDEGKLDKARKVFQLGLKAGMPDSFSPPTEPVSSPSGEPANG